MVKSDAMSGVRRKLQNDHVHDWYASPNFIRDDQIKENEEGEENNIYVGEEKCLHGFGGEI